MAILILGDSKMFLSWNDGFIPSTLTATTVHDYVKFIHGKMIQAGGITHFSEAQNQYNLDTPPVLSSSSSYTGYVPNGLNTFKPLYYKFTTTDNKVVYISIALFYTSRSTSGYPIFPHFIVNISQTFVPYTVYNNPLVTYQTSPYNTIVQTTYISGGMYNYYNGVDVNTSAIGGGTGFIKTDVDKGTLYCGMSLGITNISSSFNSYGGLFICLKVDDYGISFIKPRDNTIVSGLGVTSVAKGINSAEVMSIGKGRVYNISASSMTCDAVKTDSIIPFTYINGSGGIGIFDDLYIYSASMISDTGLLTIDGVDYHFIGNTIQTLNLGWYPEINNNLSICVRI